ncbi:MAG TPA: hypothetical protein VJR94_10210 [Candidatus Nitrosocosmicus sp.]|nr:hypothetical protein [Candidatus Nitrosocosmicus sp.]
MDAVTYRKLKESGYKYPNLTTLVQDPEIMLALYLESLNLPVNELDILWDCQMITHIVRGFREVFFHVEKLSREKGIKFRIIVEMSEENAWFLKSMKYCEVRQLDTISENFQLIDTKICVKPMFEHNNEQFSQILWSNSKSLVNEKQNQFENLWKIAQPHH